MKNIICLGFISFSLAACGGSDSGYDDAEFTEDVVVADSENAGTKYADSGKQIAWNEVGKDAIRAKLKDPDSAQFRNVDFYSGSGQPITCGEVNSKNSFGGYGGFERFIAAGNVITVLESEMEPGGMDESWAMFCK